jgi:hypothetical protein
MTPTQLDHAVQQVCTAISNHSQRCFNPLCCNEVERNARDDRLYCSDQCRQSARIIRRASKLLESLSDDEVVRIVRNGASD